MLDLLRFAAGITGTPAHALRTVISPDPSVCVVLASQGYPDKPRTGDRITGIPEAESLGATVFHAGTKMSGSDLVTSGGRVLGVTASGADLKAATAAAYAAAENDSLRWHAVSPRYRAKGPAALVDPVTLEFATVSS